MEATDRSISPLMMISVIGSVMIAISPLDRPRLNRLFPVRKSGEAADPTMTMSRTTTASPVSQRTAPRSRPAMSLMAGPPAPQRAGEALGDCLVEGDGDDEQEAPDRLVPERRDAEHVERRADHGAAAAEDRDAADHDGRHDLQLVAGARARLDGPVLRGPQHAGDAGDGAADAEGGEHPPAHRDAGQPGRLRVGPDRVQVAPGTERPHVVRA